MLSGPRTSEPFWKEASSYREWRELKGSFPQCLQGKLGLHEGQCCSQVFVGTYDLNAYLPTRAPQVICPKWPALTAHARQGGWASNPSLG